jgi:thiol-disulfide isomerase/thioredoxin
MQSIISLRTDDFQLDHGTKGLVMCTGIKGVSLVMFYSMSCPICVQLLPDYKRLPQLINGCRFCVVNVNQNADIIEMSNQTIAPIEVVPYLILFINGRPFLQFDDEPVLHRLVSFLQYSLRLIDTKRSFVNRGARVESDIPKYSIAAPYLDFKCSQDGFCYLTADKAYGKHLQVGQGLAPPGTGSGSMTTGGTIEPTNNPQYFQRS